MVLIRCYNLELPRQLLQMSVSTEDQPLGTGEGPQSVQAIGASPQPCAECPSANRGAGLPWW